MTPTPEARPGDQWTVGQVEYVKEALAELRELQEALKQMVKEFDDLDEDELLATPAPLLLAWGALTNVLLAASSEEPR